MDRREAAGNIGLATVGFTLFESVTSGKAGGLENRGPLKAVVNHWPPYKVATLSKHLKLVNASVFSLLFLDVFPNDRFVSADC